MDAVKDKIFDCVGVSLKLSLHSFAAVFNAKMCVSIFRVNLCKVKVCLGKVLF